MVSVYKSREEASNDDPRADSTDRIFACNAKPRQTCVHLRGP